MPTLEQTRTKNTLSAILLYEISRLEQLPIAMQIRIASELTAAFQNLHMSQSHADQAVNQNQAAYFSAVKRDMLEQKNQSDNQVRFAIASIMHCVHKGYEVEGLQNELIRSTINWVRECIAKTQT
jgi:hypothetical protein